MNPSQANQYMVDCTLPHHLSDAFISLIPKQRAIVNRLLSEGRILNYALALENSKLWFVCTAVSEAELMELISQLPLMAHMQQVRISELALYNTANAFAPAFSEN
jgi:hypothetical protein